MEQNELVQLCSLFSFVFSRNLNIIGLVRLISLFFPSVFNKNNDAMDKVWLNSKFKKQNESSYNLGGKLEVTLNFMQHRWEKKKRTIMRER